MTAGIFTEDRTGIIFSVQVIDPGGIEDQGREDKVFTLRQGVTCNKRNMMLLVWALESGRYGQGSEKLRPANDKFCCLGVACDISGLGEWENVQYGGWRYLVRGTLPDDIDIQVGDFYLPTSVQEWLGVNDQNPAVCNETAPWGHESGVSLGELNDNDPRYDFRAIAAVIRKVYLEG